MSHVAKESVRSFDINTYDKLQEVTGVFPKLRK